VRNVLNGSQKAADLTKQLLAYSGKGRFVLEEVNINTLVKEMSDILRVALPKGVILEEEYGEGIPAISADRSQLAQVLMNLITNAGESIGTRSGTVTIETELVDADEDYFDGSEWHSKAEPGHYIKLSVTDDGEGMDQETRSKIFEPFFTTKFTGRGLGLAAVLGIVRGHDGTLRVRSNPGDGTTFDVLLPASEAPAQRATEAPSEFEKAELYGTALVIDDERSIRSIAKRILEMAGMEVLTAEDGPGGLELYEQNPNGFTVVLLDMTMPGMSGHEVFERMREITPDQCVVLSSGYAEQDAVSRFEGDQLSGFIQKPYKPTELVEAIERAIASPLGPPAE
jgi:CheY-like chemotaxis protein